MSSILKLRGELLAVNRFLDQLRSEEVDFMVTSPTTVDDSDGLIEPDTHVELVDVFVNLGSSIVGGVVVGILQRAVIDRVIRDAKNSGLRVEERPTQLTAENDQTNPGGSPAARPTVTDDEVIEGPTTVVGAVPDGETESKAGLAEESPPSEDD